MATRRLTELWRYGHALGPQVPCLSRPFCARLMRSDRQQVHATIRSSFLDRCEPSGPAASRSPTLCWESRVSCTPCAVPCLSTRVWVGKSGSCWGWRVDFAQLPSTPRPWPIGPGFLPDRVRTVGYRFKDDISVGWDYRFRAQDLDGRWSRPVGQTETFRYLWGRHYFAHNCCLYCDDVFAEAADAVFMDAWLPQYLPDARGTSIICVRNAVIDESLQSGMGDHSCELSGCATADVLASQAPVIRSKRDEIGKRIWVAMHRGLWLPRMRAVEEGPPTPDESRGIIVRMRTVRASSASWPIFRRWPSSLPLFLWCVDLYAGGWSYASELSLPLLRQRCRIYTASGVAGSFRRILRRLARGWTEASRRQ